jgi:hypothetical protein
MSAGGPARNCCNGRREQGHALMRKTFAGPGGRSEARARVRANLVARFLHRLCGVLRRRGVLRSLARHALAAAH